MENTLEFHKMCVKKLLSEYESLKTHWADIELIFDDERKSYMVIRVGWFGQKRVHLCLIHIDIGENEIVIQANNTEDMIDEALIAMGIERKQIYLGLLPPQVRVRM
jgi:SpoVK/Ycf46/Vps4 family AAA+-type ATPase